MKTPIQAKAAWMGCPHDGKLGRPAIRVKTAVFSKLRSCDWSLVFSLVGRQLEHRPACCAVTAVIAAPVGCTVEVAGGIEDQAGVGL